MKLQEMQSIGGELAPLYKGASFLAIHACPLKKYLLSFSSGKHLLVSLHDLFLRFHPCKAKYVLLDQDFTNTLNHHLKNQKLINLYMVNDDRVLVCKFEDHYLIFELFTKKPNCYLTDRSLTILFSLYPSGKKDYAIHSCAIEKKQSHSFEEIEKDFCKKEQEYELKLKREKLLKKVQQKIKYYQKEIQKLDIHFAQCLGWEKAQHTALLLQANLYKIKPDSKEVSILDWESGKEVAIPIEPCKDSAELLKKYFKKAKKLKQGIEPTKRQLELVKQSLEKWETAYQEALGKENFEELDRYELVLFPVSETKEREPKVYHEYYSRSGKKIWVGKSAKNNDKLTFSLARGSDYWFHVSGYPGSHVIVKANKNEELDRESLEDALQLALFHSKANQIGEGEVIQSQCKFVARYKGNAPGKVHVSKHKSYYIHLDRELIKTLKR